MSKYLPEIGNPTIYGIYEAFVSHIAFPNSVPLIIHSIRYFLPHYGFLPHLFTTFIHFSNLTTHNSLPHCHWHN